MNTVKIRSYPVRFDMKRLEFLTKNNIKVLRYKTGSFSHSLIRMILITNNISYENVLQVRTSDDLDHWALVVRHDKDLKPFDDVALLS